MGIVPLCKGAEKGCSGPEDSPQLMRFTECTNRRCSGTSPLPRTHTHRSAGDPSNPSVWPAAPPAIRPAALLPAAWLDSRASRHSGTKAEKWASRRLRLNNCNQSRRISQGSTDPALGGVREGSESVVAPPPPGTSLRGRQPLGLARPQCLVLQAPETANSEGVANGRGRSLQRTAQGDSGFA